MLQMRWDALTETADCLIYIPSSGTPGSCWQGWRWRCRRAARRLRRSRQWAGRRPAAMQPSSWQAFRQPAQLAAPACARAVSGQLCGNISPP